MKRKLDSVKKKLDEGERGSYINYTKTCECHFLFRLTSRYCSVHSPWPICSFSPSGIDADARITEQDKITARAEINYDYQARNIVVTALSLIEKESLLGSLRPAWNRVCLTKAESAPADSVGWCWIRVQKLLTVLSASTNKPTLIGEQSDSGPCADAAALATKVRMSRLSNRIYRLQGPSR